MNRFQPPILVVDDDAAVLEVLGGQIALGGYRAELFQHPREAGQALRRTRYAAIISDYKMPGMSGLDLLALSREVQPCATRILVTGVLSIDSLLGSIENGLIHRFLAKPWARVELLAAVEAAVQHHRLIEENQHLRTEAERQSRTLNAAEAKVDILFEQLTRRDAGPSANLQAVREVEPAELRPGMTVARAFTSPAGLLLLQPGDELTPATIDRLRSPGLEAAPRPVLVYERLTLCG